MDVAKLFEAIEAIKEFAQEATAGLEALQQDFEIRRPPGLCQVWVTSQSSIV